MKSEDRERVTVLFIKTPKNRLKIIVVQYIYIYVYPPTLFSRVNSHWIDNTPFSLTHDHTHTKLLVLLYNNWKFQNVIFFLKKKKKRGEKKIKLFGLWCSLTLYQPEILHNPLTSIQNQTMAGGF